MFLDIQLVFVLIIYLFHDRTVLSNKLTATEQKKIFTSPKYPGSYKRPASSEWVIRAAGHIEDGVVHMKVLDSNLSNTFNCYEDIVEVMDGPSSLYTVIRDWCGDSYPTGEIITSSSSATVSFSASKIGTKFRGFKIEYWARSSTKHYLPVKMTLLNWGLLLCSGVIYGVFIGGCAFLYAVEKDRRKILKEEKDSWVTIDDIPEDYLENLEDEREKVRRKRLKAIQDKEAKMQRKLEHLKTFPPIDNYMERVVHLKDWKSLMINLDFSKRK